MIYDYSCLVGPLKSKLNRYEAVLNEIGSIYKEIKAERLRNLNLIEGSTESEFSSIKTGQIPAVERIKYKIENCKTWDEIKNLIPILKEIRFLGSPKRTEISQSLIKKLEEVYEEFPEDENLIKFLLEMVSYEQLNPLIIPEEATDECSETFKKIIYTVKDLNSGQ